MPDTSVANLARLFAAADHEVTVSFGRDAAKLGELAERVGAAVGNAAG